MNSARLPKKRNPDWLDTLLHTDFFGSCADHTDHGKNEKSVFCIDCKLCCCKSCRASMTHFQHRSLQIVKYFGQDLVCLRDIRIYFDCSRIQVSFLLMSFSIRHFVNLICAKYYVCSISFYYVIVWSPTLI